eukprot:TRINITY_DN4807_c0_g1_i2.p1 TRINITY_DN4807_c0_g1~~TRINITY_DN4807_c0_g1_i2.p1  ORF type:complete len:266 (-),score=33.14 TRINITY_DN4807_c0_g1_i2:112-909(-)
MSSSPPLWLGPASFAVALVALKARLSGSSKTSQEHGAPFALSQLPTNDALSVVNPARAPAEPHAPTPQDVLGPFYVLGAPFRGKISPPDAQGVPIVISGRVLDAASGEALPFTVLDMWQADPGNAEYDFHFADGKPETYHPSHDPDIVQAKTGGRSSQYRYRTRVVADHNGRYEVETVKPPPYYDPDDVCECTSKCLCAWRCPHIHVFAQPTRTGNSELITQLYFEGSEYNDTDKHFNQESVIEISQPQGRTYQVGKYDIYLPRS